MLRLDPPLNPRTGKKLKVLAICRISTVHQDERSLEDQEASYRSWLSSHTDLPFDMDVISGRGSGESLERQEYQQAVEAVESLKYDLVITEDLGRVCRRVHALIFCETCQDADCRLVAINDSIDTAREGWETHSFFAMMKHATCNADTSKRIRRSLRNRFTQGGVLGVTIYGYLKPEGAKSDEKLYKDPSAEPIYDEWFSMLERGATFSQVADWLNDRNVPVGPGSTVKEWNCAMVGRVTRNPILKGLRVRNRKKARRVNKTGQRRSVDAPPEELLERHCPHLAFIEPERYDRVIRMLEVRNSKYSRRTPEGTDGRANVPKKRTRWPGQHIHCGVCGRLFVFGGHGKRDKLMCNGAREHKCWNGATVDGPLAVQKLMTSIYAHIESLPDFDSLMLASLREEQEELAISSEEQLQELERKIVQAERAISNVVRAITRMDNSEALDGELRRLESEKQRLQVELDQLSAESLPVAALPSIQKLRTCFQESIQDMDPESWEFADVMKRLIPKIVVFPYQPIDGGHVVLRAKFRIDLSTFLDGSSTLQGRLPSLEHVLEVDLFDPPQRIEFREKVMHLRESGLTEKATAQELGITHTAAQRAARLTRLMKAQEMEGPYRPVIEPDDRCTNLHRHKHQRYRFEPLPSPEDL